MAGAGFATAALLGAGAEAAAAALAGAAFAAGALAAAGLGERSFAMMGVLSPFVLLVPDAATAAFAGFFGAAAFAGAAVFAAAALVAAVFVAAVLVAAVWVAAVLLLLGLFERLFAAVPPAVPAGAGLLLVLLPLRAAAATAFFGGLAATLAAVRLLGAAVAFAVRFALTGYLHPVLGQD